jgi:hypothetical protein
MVVRVSISFWWSTSVSFPDVEWLWQRFGTLRLAQRMSRWICCLTSSLVENFTILISWLKMSKILVRCFSSSSVKLWVHLSYIVGKRSEKSRQWRCFWSTDVLAKKTRFLRFVLSMFAMTTQISNTFFLSIRSPVHLNSVQPVLVWDILTTFTIAFNTVGLKSLGFTKILIYFRQFDHRPNWFPIHRRDRWVFSFFSIGCFWRFPTVVEFISFRKSWRVDTHPWTTHGNGTRTISSPHTLLRLGGIPEHLECLPHFRRFHTPSGGFGSNFPPDSYLRRNFPLYEQVSFLELVMFSFEVEVRVKDETYFWMSVWWKTEK